MTVEASFRRHLVSPDRSAWGFLCLVLVVGSAMLFAFYGVKHWNNTQAELRLIPTLRFDWREDFNYFYAGASMAWHGDAAELYPERGERTLYPRDPIFDQPLTEYEQERLLARGNYYNPPALAFLQSALVPLGFHGAYWLFTLVGLTCVIATLGLTWREGKGIPELPILVLGVLSFRPVHEVLIMGHTTFIFVLVLTGGFLLLRADKQVQAGLVLSLLALKPQWAILPGAFLLFSCHFRAAATMAAAGAAIVAIPFLFLGWQTFENYYEFLSYSAEVDLKDAPHMFSWNGFLSKMDGSEFRDGQLFLYADAPSRELVYGLIALTALPVLAVWWSRDYFLSVAALIVGMLLISTHSVWYDWALISVAAIFLVLRSRNASHSLRLEMYIVLLALYISTGIAIEALVDPDRHRVDWYEPVIYWVTPVAFISLYWMASIPIRERLAARGQPDAAPLPMRA